MTEEQYCKAIIDWFRNIGEKDPAQYVNIPDPMFENSEIQLDGWFDIKNLAKTIYEKEIELT